MGSSVAFLVFLLFCCAFHSSLSLKAPVPIGKKPALVQRQQQRTAVLGTKDISTVLKPKMIESLMKYPLFIEGLRYAGPLFFLSLQASSALTG
jgi:hypothetical protein